MLLPGKNKTLQIIIHIIGWGIMFGFPFLFSAKNEPVNLTWYLGYCFIPVTFMFVFYINFFLLIDHFLFRKKIVLFIVINMLLIVSAVYFLHQWHTFYTLHISVKPKDLARPMPPVLLFLARDYVLMSLTAGLAVAIKMTGKWYKIETEKKELEKVHTEAELRNLKSQLNPHFLFNTLNNIYTLIALNPERAQVAVHDLSRLLRHVLYDNNENQVALDRELAFMKSYIELMGLRLSNKVNLEVNIPENTGNIMVAPLLFITLIENAFKHGVSPTEKSYIHIDIKIPGNEQIICCIQNSFFPKKDNDRSGSGIGLSNLQKRLALTYPGHYTFETGRKGNEYVAMLIIHLKAEIV